MDWLIWAAAVAALGGSSVRFFRTQWYGAGLVLAFGALAAAMLALATGALRV